MTNRVSLHVSTINPRRKPAIDRYPRQSIADTTNLANAHASVHPLTASRAGPGQGSLRESLRHDVQNGPDLSGQPEG